MPRPTATHAHESCAVALSAAGRYDEARVYAEQSLAMSPEPKDTDSDSLFITLACRGEVDRMESCLAKIPTAQAEGGQAYYNRLLTLGRTRSRGRAQGEGKATGQAKQPASRPSAAGERNAGPQREFAGRAAVQASRDYSPFSSPYRQIFRGHLVT